MGLKPGEKLEKLAVIRVLNVRREQLCQILGDEKEPTREGFPHLTSAEFEEMFCKHMGCHYTDEVTRIEFEYV